MKKCPETGNSPNSGTCSCVFCLAERARWQREYRKRKPNLLRQMNLKKYGLTVAEYENKLAEQNGVCAICENPEKHHNQHGLMSLAVDHDHSTGQIRKLLCSQCNRALGLLRDDPAIIGKLLDYRRAYAKKEIVCGGPDVGAAGVQFPGVQ